MVHLFLAVCDRKLQILNYELLVYADVVFVIDAIISHICELRIKCGLKFG